MLEVMGSLVPPGLRRRVLRRAAAGALAQERRRLAADVHDLVMQDLLVAVASARTLLDDPELAPEASSMVVAGERALAAAREIVGDLTARDVEPLAQAIEASVRAAARRAHLRFDALGVPAGARTDVATCDALVHIGREAVTNGVKHGGASAIEVLLEHDDEWRLKISDDGRGFEPETALRGFGLSSMRRMAVELGGALHVRSAPGRGTTVEATLP
jgi:signal transduction histidine kinase